MPYSPEHKEETRARIVQCAHGLFNRRGFSEVSIDEIMAEAGLTRGGFYNHFKNKEELFAEVMVAYVEQRRAVGGGTACGPEVAQRIFDSYVSRAHLEDVGGHCPLMALPSDVGRAGPAVQAAYRGVLEALVAALARNLEPAQGTPEQKQGARQDALAIAAMCVGAMVLARTIADDALADEIFAAARGLTAETIGAPGEGA